jgi:hypothetical protein
LDYRPFFRARGSYVAGSDVALHCYELAKFYGTDPDVFLNKPISSINRAIKRTSELIAATKAAAED